MGRISHLVHHNFHLRFSTRMNSVREREREEKREREGGKERTAEDEVANCLHVTRFIMLAPIARNTLRSFHGVIHRGVITNAYCGSAEARASEQARGPQISWYTRYIVRRYLSSSLSLPLSRLDFNFVPVSSASRRQIITTGDRSVPSLER